MSARLARLALALYPLAYRRRYGAEMAALLEDAGASPVTVLDLLRGALSAHLRPVPALETELGPDERLRQGLGGILVCWVVFSLAGLGLYKTTEDYGFTTAGGAHRLLGVAHTAIQALALLATAAVAIGAAPLVVLALRQARERREVGRATVLALGCVAVFALASLALLAIVHWPVASGDGFAAVGLIVWAALALGCGIGCAMAARRGLFALAVPRTLLRASVLCAVVLALGMAGIVLATAVYLLALLHDAPGLAGQSNGPLGLVSVAASLAIQLAVMVAVAVPAGIGALRIRRG